jgi:hypothetical protein
MSQPKTHAQIKRIFGLGHKLNAGKDELEQMAGKRLSLLSFDEANELIKRLGGEPLDIQPSSASRTPRRTVNYRRKKAGIRQIAQPAHLQLMDELAANRGITDDGLKNLCRRMLGYYRPRTTSDTNKIIEAIKAMNARDAKRAKEAA